MLIIGRRVLSEIEKGVKLVAAEGFEPTTKGLRVAVI